MWFLHMVLLLEKKLWLKRSADAAAAEAEVEAAALPRSSGSCIRPWEVLHWGKEWCDWVPSLMPLSELPSRWNVEEDGGDRGTPEVKGFGGEMMCWPCNEVVCELTRGRLKNMLLFPYMWLPPRVWRPDGSLPFSCASASQKARWVMKLSRLR